jgi:hypothetical protein
MHIWIELARAPEATALQGNEQQLKSRESKRHISQLSGSALAATRGHGLVTPCRGRTEGGGLTTG